MHTVGDLGGLLRRAWTPYTSSVPEECTLDNPSRGQCAVTALIVQDIFGGLLLRTTVRGESHYLNLIPAGPPVDEVRVDLTLGQFGEGAEYDAPPELRLREYVLSFPDTRRRYKELRANMIRCMAEDMA